MKTRGRHYKDDSKKMGTKKYKDGGNEFKENTKRTQIMLLVSLRTIEGGGFLFYITVSVHPPVLQ